MKKTTIIFIILDLLVLTALFLTYGPYDYFRNLLITTAMTTQKHHYLAKTFYTDKIINNVIQQNYVSVFDEDTNTGDISFGEMSENITYDSIYEEQVLKKDEGNDLYKVIPVSGPGYRGYITVIYDPSRITLGLSKKLGTSGQFIDTIAKNENAFVAINASGFLDPKWMGDGGEPTGIIIHEGKIIDYGNPINHKGIIGFNKDNVLVLSYGTAEEALKKGIDEAVQFGPFLVVNGKPAFIKGNGGWGIAPRTAIAQRKDGIVLFATIDGRQPGYSLGIDMVEMTKLLVRYGAHNASNLDGGSSTALIINGNIYNKPVASNPNGLRYIPNAWLVK